MIGMAVEHCLTVVDGSTHRGLILRDPSETGNLQDV